MHEEAEMLFYDTLIRRIFCFIFAFCVFYIALFCASRNLKALAKNELTLGVLNEGAEDAFRNSTY